MEIKLQSAVEYLMTYGWAILIIAVVLGALFSLGIFNSFDLAPKASPGACYVSRPNGPGSTSFVNTVGTCDNIPEYTMLVKGNGYVYIQNISQMVSSYNTITISGWFYNLQGSGTTTGFVAGNTEINQGYIYFSSGGSCGNGEVAIGIGSTAACTAPGSLSFVKNWIFVVATYNSMGLSGWVCSSGICTASDTVTPSFDMNNYGYLYIGSDPSNPGNGWQGYISNIEVYNTSFSVNDTLALYHEGIGGAPIALRWLQGWWPLNDNANDYSGNDNTGVATNVIYITNWESNYANPG